MTIRVVTNQTHGPAFVQLLEATDRMPEALWSILLHVGPPCVVPINNETTSCVCAKPATGFIVRCCDDNHLRYSPICTHHHGDLEIWLEAGQVLECEDCDGPTASGFVTPEAVEHPDAAGRA
jgi:hypothetical protein